MRGRVKMATVQVSRPILMPIERVVCFVRGGGEIPGRKTHLPGNGRSASDLRSRNVRSVRIVVAWDHAEAREMRGITGERWAGEA